MGGDGERGNLGGHRHGKQLPEIIGHLGFTSVNAGDAGLQQHNAKHSQIAQLEAHLEHQHWTERQQHKQGGCQTVEHIRVAPDRDEREHCGRARHRGGKACDMGIKPDGQHQ